MRLGGINKMLGPLEQMHSYEDIIDHDFSPEYVCGKCGSKLRFSAGHGFECPSCHQTYPQIKQGE